jgi:hypothetical protein
VIGYLVIGYQLPNYLITNYFNQPFTTILWPIPAREIRNGRLWFGPDPSRKSHCGGRQGPEPGRHAIFG